MPAADVDREVELGHDDAGAQTPLLIRSVADTYEIPDAPRAAGDDAGDRSEHDEARRRRDARAGPKQVLAPALSELVAVTPRGHLWPERRPDAHELEAIADSCEPNVVGRHAQPSSAEHALALFDRLPTLLERRQVPPLTGPADGP